MKVRKILDTTEYALPSFGHICFFGDLFVEPEDAQQSDIGLSFFVHTFRGVASFFKYNDW